MDELDYKKIKMNQKIDQAKNKLAATFISFVHKEMIGAGIDVEQRRVFHPSFLYTMKFILLFIAERVRALKASVSQSLNEREKDIVVNLSHEYPIEFNLATLFQPIIKSLTSKFSNYAKNILREAEFNPNEIEDESSTYVAFLSISLISLSETYFRYKSMYDKCKCNSQSIASKVNEPEEDVLTSKVCSASSELLSSRIYLIKKTRRHLIYCVETENKITTLKVLRASAPRKYKELLNREFKIGKTVNHPAFRSTIERITFQGRDALVLEHASGVTLDEIENVVISDFLLMAREIVSGLLAVHQKQLMHLNFSSEHVILDKKLNTAKIIGYASSRYFSSESNCVANKEVSEMDLRFISPEQTMRAKRTIDHRADLYSLGVIFFKLLTGRHPFDSKDPLSLIHMHIFDDPPRAKDINEKIPLPISDMIGKLLNKHAEERYQSAKGIIHDLDLMISVYQTDTDLSSVVLSQHDKADMILIPQKSVGRAKEFNRLLEVFERVKQNSFEIAFVTGFSGVGKSTLVYELCKPIFAAGGLFLCGKFDETKTHPFSAVLEAISSFCDDVLLRKKITLANYRYKIQEAVGDEGQALTDLIPNLSLVIGQQPPISEAFGEEAKLRFNYLLLKFFKAICAVGLPIVLLLDDLQWIDMQTMEFLSNMVEKNSIGKFMILGTYRGEEVGSSQLVSKFIAHAKENGISPTIMKLENLQLEDVNCIVSEALNVSPFVTYSLSTFIHNKTKGNPFFICQMIKSLQDQNLIFFCSQTATWKWDKVLEDEQEVAGGVLELLREKILKHDKYTQQAFKIASCLGSSFYLCALSLIINNKQGIERAIATGMIIQYKGDDSKYYFAHDEIRRASFSLLPKNCKDIFLYIGKKLWKQLTDDELRKNMFVVADLLRHAVGKVADDTEKKMMAEFFLSVGRRALANTAFDKSLKNLCTGIQLLGENNWKNNYDLSLELFDITAKAAYCSGDEVKMNTLIEEISMNAKLPLHVVKSKCLLIRHYSDQIRCDESIQVGISALQDIGQGIDMEKALSTVSYEVECTKILILKKGAEDITAMKPMTNKIAIAAILIMKNILSSAYCLNPPLFALVSAKMVKLTLKYGFSKLSSIGFSAFATALLSVGDKLSHRFGVVASHLLEKSKWKEAIPYVHITMYCFIAPFYSPIHSSIEPLLRTHKVSLEVGLREFVFISKAFYGHYSLMSGKNLQRLLDTLEELEGTQTKVTQALHQAVLNLLDEKYNCAVITGDYFDFRSFHRTYKDHEQKSDYRLSRILVISIMLAYLFYEHEVAWEFLKEFETVQHFVRTQYHFPISIFYKGLTSAAMARKDEDRRDKLKIIKSCISKLQKMAEFSPENFLNKVHLMEAELASLTGLDSKADMHYKQAISFSRSNAFVHEEGIACELAALHYQRQERNDQSSYYFSQSLWCYKSWGSLSKVRKFLKRYSSNLQEENTDVSDKFPNNELDISQMSISNVSELSYFSQKNKRVRFSNS